MKKITAFLLCIGIMIEAIMLNTNNVYAITVGGSSITVKFNYKNNHAWEQDFKPGHWNNDSIDDVNLAIYAGHGLKKEVLEKSGLAGDDCE